MGSLKLSCVGCGPKGNETVLGTPMVGAGQGVGWGAWRLQYLSLCLQDHWSERGHRSHRQPSLLHPTHCCISHRRYHLLTRTFIYLSIIHLHDPLSHRHNEIQSPWRMDFFSLFLCLNTIVYLFQVYSKVIQLCTER